MAGLLKEYVFLRIEGELVLEAAVLRLHLASSAADIRLSSRHLEAIQKRALAEGLPYQTLIASLPHKYATGRLKET